MVIVPDPAFDNRFDLKLALEAASRQIDAVNSTRLIISGGINPDRIRKVLQQTDKRFYKYLGFAVGSWLLSNSKSISENLNKETSLP